MPEGQVLEFTHVTKHFNEVAAVSDFSARVEPGAVTAFLGPNGAGKTTTLRILLGQLRATSGTATIGGAAYAELRQPLRTIGAVLEETVYRPRRTAERQLTIAAKANGIPLARVGEVLSLVGLDGEGDSRIGGFSLGMRQRLSVAHALLGDPGALVFDEPANGLDPEGIRWMRLLMRRLADEGRTVLVSSHVLSEVEQVADNVIVLSKGQLVLASGIETLADQKGGSVIVDAADRDALTAALASAGFDIEVLRSGLTVRGGDAGTVGAVAADAGIALSTLVQRGPTLEDVFIDLMRGGRLAAPVDAAPQQLVAPISAAVDVTPEDSTPRDAESDAAPVPAESVVAIPVAAAAAWAAEAAAAPADEAVAEDLAETVAGNVDAWSATSASVEEEAAAEEPVIEEPVTDAPAEQTPAEQIDETQIASGQDDEDRAEELPSRSFDEILFGSAAPSAAVSATASDEERPTDDAADTTDEAHDSATEQVPTDLEADVTGTASEDDVDPAGVEIFADLDDTSAAAEAGTSEEAASEDDPRSAAVSSMLAAAARAYYEDEPKDYPVNAEESGSPDDSAHWSVASTGVIDTVPVPASSDAATDETDSDESAGGSDSGESETDSDENSGGRASDDEANHDEENHHG